MRLGHWLSRLGGIALVLFLVVPAQAGDEKGGKPSPFAFVRPPSAAPDELQNQVLDIFDSKCAFAGCHTGVNAPRNLDLSEEVFVAKLVNVKSADFPRMMLVKPGDAANSYFMKKVKGAPGIKGDRMPRGTAPLSPGEINTLDIWINARPANVQVDMPHMNYAQPFCCWWSANPPGAST